MNYQEAISILARYPSTLASIRAAVERADAVDAELTEARTMNQARKNELGRQRREAERELMAALEVAGPALMTETPGGEL